MVDLVTQLAYLVVGLVQLFVALGLAILAIYLGITILDRATPRVPLMEEIKRKNTAAGITVGSAVISITIVIQSGVQGMTSGLGSSSDLGSILRGLGEGFLTVVVGMIFAVLALYLALWVMQKIVSVMPVAVGGKLVEGAKADLQEEIKNGNVAAAVMLAGVFIGISIVLQACVLGLVHAVWA